MTLTALAVSCAPVVLVVPAATAAAAGVRAASSVPCVKPASTQARSGREAPEWRTNNDMPEVQQQDLEALPASETRKGVVAREVEPVLPSTVVIPVYVHVIKGKHRHERPRIGKRRVQRLITILNNGMAGRQSSLSVPTRYRFTLRKIDYRKRDGWYHAFFNGPRDTRMKRKLHRGNARTLNLYINGGGPRNNPVLGWARFPWQYTSNRYLDGVSVNNAAIPGGRARGYNSGDTLIHETGHWLGLLHTFEGGCEGSGDLVSDTPAEDEPSFYCQTTRDTCPAPGLDPVHNFMDYSLDSCMYMFTAGQVRRMDTAFERWRY